MRTGTFAADVPCKSGLNYYTAVDFEHGVYPASYARVLSESIAILLPGSIHVGLAPAVCRFSGLSLRTRAAAYSDECLYWGGISFTTTRPLVPATCVVRHFPQEITTCKGYRLYRNLNHK